MVLSFNEEIEFENLKQKGKIELSDLEHKNRMEELSKELEIAKCNLDQS